MLWCSGKVGDEDDQVVRYDTSGRLKLADTIVRRRKLSGVPSVTKRERGAAAAPKDQMNELIR